MRNLLALLVGCLALSACQKPLVFPFVQKYQVSVGDVFYFRADGQFVLVERRKATDVQINSRGEAVYAFPDRISTTRRVARKPGDFWGAGGPDQPDTLESVELAQLGTPITVLAIDPRVTKLAGGAADGSLWMWDLPLAQTVTQLQDAAEIQALAFSPDGKILATGLGTHIVGTTLAINPGRLRLWDVARGLLLEHLGEPAVNALTFAADGRLAAGLEDGSVLIRPAAGGDPMKIQISTAAVTSLAWHPAGDALAIAQSDKGVRLWDVTKGKQLGMLVSEVPNNPLFPRGIERIAFSANGTRIGVAYADGEMRIWDTSALNPKPKPAK